MEHITLASYYTVMELMQQNARLTDLLTVRIYVLRCLHEMPFSNPCNRASYLHIDRTPSQIVCQLGNGFAYRSNALIIYAADPVSIHVGSESYGFVYERQRQIEAKPFETSTKWYRVHVTAIMKTMNTLQGTLMIIKNTYEYLTNSIETI